MKILILIISLSLISCIDNDKEAVINFLNKNLKSDSRIQILEISKSDSIYSPYDDLTHLELLCAFTSNGIAQYSSNAWQAKSKKESIAYLDSAISIYNTEKVKIDSMLSNINLTLKSPSYIKGKKNRKAVKVKYKIDENTFYDTFFFENKASIIGHSSNNITLSINEYKIELLDIENEYRRAIKDKKDMLKGNIIVYTW